MSRSLSRIRSLVSDIEEIHRQGQSSRTAKPNSVVSDVAEVSSLASSVTPERVQATQENSATVATVHAAPSFSVDPDDSFAELAHVVHLDKSPAPGKIFMKLSGAVALSLQIEDTNETVEVVQVGPLLEIRFNDGKVFHLPLKAVA